MHRETMPVGWFPVQQKTVKAGANGSTCLSAVN